ncbi:MAG: stage V sporulation protein AB [Lachnospiraceae bacterium]|nr:stage V sporulation protein AB [Lachnospiraceae bacterium]
MRSLFLAIIGGSFGLLAAAGVFTVFVAVGIIPRFAGRTHTANKIFLYEEMVTIGSIAGGVVSIFPEYCGIGAFLQAHLQGGDTGALALLCKEVGMLAQAIFGLFAGMFVGCLALAIAEMLDSIPIFSRRISFRHGLGLAVLAMALGKLCGSLFYFWDELHRVMP